jgi:Uncharacterized conserved protein (COG2071)
MSALKNMRLQFTGELHEIHLVNFSVDPAELRDLIPAPLKLRLVHGRAMISMVDVHLRNMRATSKLFPFRFAYQHIGFRVLIEDARWNAEKSNKGIYFLRSFTERPFMAWAGNLLTNYRLENAELVDFPAGLEMQAGDQFLKYHLAGPDLTPDSKLLELQQTIGAIDRAWAVENHELQKTQIVREKWPLLPMKCTRFSTNFFETARLEGVFKVPEKILYTWLPAESVQVLDSTPAFTPTVLAHA